MTRLLRLLKSFRGSSPSHKGTKQAESCTPLPAAPVSPEWLDVDRLHWLQFLSSTSGKLLMQRGRAVLFHVQGQACKDVFHTKHSAGVAQGFGDCLTWLESLSRSSRVNDVQPEAVESSKTDSPPPGEADLAEQFSP